LRRVKGFTLVELLVVIAVIALLMAILLPVLGRVKRQAKAVVCRSNLRQWGLWFPMYTADNDDKFFGRYYIHPTHTFHYWTTVMRPYYKNCRDVLLCPMATKFDVEKGRLGLGSTFSAWNTMWRGGGDRTHKPEFLGSYGLNSGVRNDGSDLNGLPPDHPYEAAWKTTQVKGVADIPVLLDCASPVLDVSHLDSPMMHEDEFPGDFAMSYFAINRHAGYVNALFMDWTVRKVGLKELWTLNWHREFDRAGPWTKAGGAEPEDWPDWMRKFKDY